MGRLVYNLLDYANLGDSSVGKGWRRSGGLAWNGLLSFLGEYMASSGLLTDYQARVFKTLVIFYGLIPRSCSVLPLLPFHFVTA